MNGSDEKLTAKQEAFLATLLTMPTLTEAARAVRISDATARRWLTLPSVQAAWLDMRRQVVDQALLTVQTATMEAVATLRDCLADKMPPGVRIRAATAILDTAIRAIEINELAVRIKQLEQALEEKRIMARSQRQRVRRFA